MVERLLGHHERARALLRHELGTVGNPATAAGLELELGMVALLAGDFTADRELIDKAYRTARQMDNTALQAHAAALIALADYTSGAVRTAQTRADTAAGLLDATPDHTLGRTAPAGPRRTAAVPRGAGGAGRPSAGGSPRR